MKNLREWATYYCNNQIAVYPSYDTRYDLFDRYSNGQTLKEVLKYNWEGSDWIGGLVGADNIVILELDFINKGGDYMLKVVSRCLCLLELYNYPWVITNKDKVLILFKCVSIKRGKEGLGRIGIIWTGFYELPYDIKFKKSEATFYFRALPQTLPMRVQEVTLNQTIEQIVDEFGLNFTK